MLDRFIRLNLFFESQNSLPSYCYVHALLLFQINVQVISVFESNNSSGEKNFCDVMLSFLEVFLKRIENQGEDLYNTTKTNKMGFNYSFALFFFYLPLYQLLMDTRIHGN